MAVMVVVLPEQIVTVGVTVVITGAGVTSVMVIEAETQDDKAQGRVSQAA
jgi:hypothetical protein